MDERLGLEDQSDPAGFVSYRFRFKPTQFFPATHIDIPGVKSRARVPFRRPSR